MSNTFEHVSFFRNYKRTVDWLEVYSAKVSLLNFRTTNIGEMVFRQLLVKFSIFLQFKY